MNTPVVQFAFLLFVIFSTPCLTGCEAPDIDVASTESASVTEGTAGNVDEESATEQEDDRGPWSGWEHLEEPLGDESFIKYKVAPSSYSVGDQVALNVAVGSGYGPIDDATISYRCTGGSEKEPNGLIAAPDEGEPWVALEKEGMYEVNWETNERTRLPGFKAPREEIYGGYMLHLAEIAVPTDRAVIEIRVQQPAADVGSFHIPATDFSFQAFPLEYGE